uniref:DC_STAMP domain-containing protein n=1 Tax=Caenorhabditis japonica TaxID=281687 RepID=A0A8R1EVF4_CAEJA
MNIIGNIHQVSSGVACVQMDVMSSKNDVEGNVMDKGAMMVSRLRAVLQNVAGPMNKICHQAKGFSTEVCSLPSIVGKGVKGAAVPFYSAYFEAIEFAIKKIFYVHIEASKWALNKVKPVIEEMKKAKTIRAEYNSADNGKPNAADDSTANLRASIKKSLMNIVNVYIRIINVISFCLRYCVMPAILIWPWIYTLRFIYGFNYIDDFKNKFLTDEFMKIDQFCAFRGTRKVMPLTAEESKKYIPRSAWKMTEDEKPRFRLDVFITIISCITPFLLCFLDFGVYKTLSTVHTLMNRTNIDTPAHYELKVAGNGSMSDIMNEFLDIFSPFTKNIRERENRWRRCFNEPDPPNYVELWLMILMFVAALLLCRLKAYFGRQTLALADHFFPNRVRIRALSLYNNILQSRRNLFAEVLNNAQKDVMGSEDVVIRRSMQSRGHVRSDCAKCEKYNMLVSDQENTRVCIHCGAFYCINCFCLTLFCVQCDEDMQTVNQMPLYYEDDSDIFEKSDNIH